MLRRKVIPALSLQGLLVPLPKKFLSSPRGYPPASPSPTSQTQEHKEHPVGNQSLQAPHPSRLPSNPCPASKRWCPPSTSLVPPKAPACAQAENQMVCPPNPVGATLPLSTQYSKNHSLWFLPRVWVRSSSLASAWCHNATV